MPQMTAQAAITLWRTWAHSLEPELDGPSQEWINGFFAALDEIEKAISPEQDKTP